ncbi:hypothetical protein J5J10_16290 [Ciceribacter sp. L1K23]|uniref:hypothetical protein n=1 Tax=Ciceribacter sp. L1K23 TaxID=2820276 RepID=UPI001B821174|nr:hypothetical protein [Ciceribacter sp. L1K23]MBR0557248.1 hypothetical protein [Ciceribacter sp. L1K23]
MSSGRNAKGNKNAIPGSKNETEAAEKAKLPLGETPMSQVAVPATINGTATLDTNKGPLPPKSRLKD